jgi:hypothetical protein
MRFIAIEFLENIFYFSLLATKNTPTIIISNPEIFVRLILSWNNNLPDRTVKAKLIAVNIGVTNESDPKDKAFIKNIAAIKTQPRASITFTCIRNGM